VLLQPEFFEALLKKIKESKISLSFQYRLYVGVIRRVNIRNSTIFAASLLKNKQQKQKKKNDQHHDKRTNTGNTTGSYHKHHH
jgi:hypothetical protein